MEKHGFDFQVFYKGQFYAFECKETHAQRLPLSNIKTHQLIELLAVQQQGGEAFILCHFVREESMVMFPIRAVADARR
ncbi:hypothetical protein LCGC14_1473300, partial [marine sediment metagenome]